MSRLGVGVVAKTRQVRDLLTKMVGFCYLLIMECRYLRRVIDPMSRSKTVNVIEGERERSSELWLCRFAVETGKSMGIGVRHCPYKYGEDQECLFPGGPFPPKPPKSRDDSDDEPYVA